MDLDYSKLARLRQVIISRNESKKIDTIKEILDSGYDINYAIPVNSRVKYLKPEWLGNTVLHFTVHDMYNFDLMELLLNYRPDITLKNNDGLTPLHLHFYTLNQYYWESGCTIDKILSAHIKFNDRTNPKCSKGISHFHIACIRNKLEVVKFFLENGSSVNEAVDATVNISSEYTGYTPLHLALESFRRDKQVVQLLLDSGADYNILNKRGISPLHMIVKNQIDYAGDEISYENNGLYLIPVSTATNFNPVDSIGLSAFHVYCTRYNTFKSEVFEKFLNYGVDINAAVDFESLLWPGYTALHFAALCNFDTVKLLLKNGANLLAEDAKGITPLDLCLQKYKPTDISCILKIQNQFESIEFDDGTKLVDVISEFSNKDNLNDYLESKDINSVIPFNSPLWPGFTLLHLAVQLSIEYNDFRVKTCLLHMPNLTIQDANEMTALQLALHMNKKICVSKILLRFYYTLTDVVKLDELYYFHIACIIGDVRIVELFLSRGVNPDEPIHKDVINFLKTSSPYFTQSVSLTDNITPLDYGTAVGYENMVQFLLERRANPYIIDNNGLTWIHRVFLSSNFDKFKSILWLYHRTLKVNVVGPGGLSLFHIACYCGSLRAVEILLPLVTNINEPINSEIMNYTTGLPALVCLGDTPLHLAVKGQSKKVVDFLLRNGADAKAVNADGFNALHTAFSVFLSLNHPLIPEDSRPVPLEVLVRLMTEFDNNGLWPDDKGLTALHIASALRDLKLVEKLLKTGINVNCRINADSPICPGETPLDVIGRVCNWGDETVELLIKNGADFFSLSKTNKVFKYRFEDQKRMVLKQRMNYEEVPTNVAGLSLFHMCCAGDDPDIVERFLQMGADVNAPKDYFAADEGGFTPLHFAILYSNSDVIDVLLKYNANFYQKDTYGQTPSVLLEKKRVENFVEFFRRINVTFWVDLGVIFLLSYWCIHHLLFYYFYR